MSAWIVSKDHVDLMVQTALSGASDSEGRWELLRWDHDGTTYEIDPLAEVGDVQALCPPYEIVHVPPSQLGQWLVDECVASVSHRYPDDEVDAGELPGPCDPYYIGPYVFAPVERESTVCVAKQISCYGYQSCEHPEWGDSCAFAFCRELERSLLGALPGYDAAPWGYDRQRV